MKNSGIYIHVPFCVKKCAYCDFYSLANVSRREEYVKALSRHIEKKAPLFRDYSVDSIFFGGGTPSLLTDGEFSDIFKALSAYNISKDAEISIEANPKTIDYNHAKSLRSLGVNRVSVGIQSLRDEELSAIGRIHTKEEAVSTVFDLQKAGFENISADLMFGLPKQTEKSLHNTISEIVKLPLTHISFYGLTLEENTPLYKSGFTEISEELYEKFYLGGVEELTKNGFSQYEISNFSKAGFECRHNKKYWNCQEYLSFGPASHGFIRGERYAYKKDLELYINEVENEEKILEFREKVSRSDALEEYIMLSLRTSEGLSFKRIESMKEVDIIPLKKLTKKLASASLAKEKPEGFYLTPKGLRVSNEIIVDVMLALE